MISAVQRTSGFPVTVSWTSGLCTVALVGLALVALTHTARAQAAWSLGRWQGEASFLTNWQKQDDKRSDNIYETIFFQEKIGLRNVGAYLLDPRVLTFNFGGSFGLSQEEAINVTSEPLRYGNGDLYDYAIDGILFADRPYLLNFFANRNQSILSQGFGGRSDSTFATHGGVFELRENSLLKEYGLLNFSSLVDVHQELVKEDSAVFGSPFRRDETRNVVRYQGHKGWETSDLDLRYEFNNVDDPLNPTDIFDRHTVRALDSFDFGPTLNRRLDSAFYYFKRTGTSPGSFISLDEAMRLDHSADFNTDYRYSFSQSDSTSGVTTTNVATAGLLHRLYRTLISTANVRAMRQDFQTGDRMVYGGQTGLDYRRSIPWGAQFFAACSGGYQIDQNNFTSSQLDVVDEPHTAPAVFGVGAGFTLNNPFVQNDTIVMVDVRGGSRLPTTLNVDYVLSQEGSLTRIIILPTSPVIRPGDPLEVSYTSNLDPSIHFSTTSADVRTGVEFPWGATSYEHILSDQTRLSGSSSSNFLIDQNLDRFKLELRQQWSTVRVQSSAAYELVRSTIVDSNALRFGQLLVYQPVQDVSAQLSGDEYFVDYPGQQRHSRSYLARASVDWFTPLGVSVSSFAGYRAFDDSSVASDEIADCGVRLHWTYRNFEVAPSFTWTDYRGRLNDMRAELRMVRRFF